MPLILYLDILLIMPWCSKHSDTLVAPVVLSIPMNYYGRICIDLDPLYYLSVLK